MTEFAKVGDLLKYGVYLGAIVIAVGLLGLYFEAGWHMPVITAGVAVVMSTPLAGLVLTTGILARIGDVKWALAAVCVIAVTLVGAAVAWFF